MKTCCCYRYVENNIRCLETIRAYSETVPEFLRNRPRKFVEHCLRRIPPSVVDINANNISAVGDNAYIVRSRDKRYHVRCDRLTVLTPSCECPDWQRNFFPCKHMLAICRVYGWTCFPEPYRNLPVFILDDSVTGHQTTDTAAQHDANMMQSGDTYCTDVEPESSEHETADLAGVDSELSDVTTSAQQRPDEQSSLVNRLQSAVRQCLSTLSTMTYTLTDEDYLQELQADLEQHVRKSKSSIDSGTACFPSRNRRRVGKRIPQLSSFKRTLQSFRTRQKMRKSSRKRRRVTTGEQYVNVSSITVCVFVKLRLDF